MVQAMQASKNDCTPNARMLVTSHRCATIMICITRTSAAISVIILLPNCGSCQKNMSDLFPQNRNVEISAVALKTNATASNSGTRNSRILALVVSTSTRSEEHTSE